MAYFKSRRHQLELLRAGQKGVPPEKILAIRDSLVKQALAGKVGAAKLLLQYFGFAPQREPDVMTMARIAELADELGPLGAAHLREVLKGPFWKPSAPNESEAEFINRLPSRP